jgi:hypothetical protein
MPVNNLMDAAVNMFGRTFACAASLSQVANLDVLERAEVAANSWSTITCTAWLRPASHDASEDASSPDPLRYGLMRGASSLRLAGCAPPGVGPPPLDLPIAKPSFRIADGLGTELDDGTLMDEFGNNGLK